MSFLAGLTVCAVPTLFIGLYALGRRRSTRFTRRLRPFVGQEVALHLGTEGRTVSEAVATGRLLAIERSHLVVAPDRTFAEPLTAELVRRNGRAYVPLRLVLDVACGDELIELRRTPS